VFGNLLHPRPLPYPTPPHPPPPPLSATDSLTPASSDVYERLSPKGGRAPFHVMLVTQTVSAVWHGLFPGYGLFFITSAFMFEASKAIFRYERAYAPSSGLLNHRTFPPWLVVKWAFTAFVLNYAASTFLVSSFSHCPGYLFENFVMTVEGKIWGWWLCAVGGWGGGPSLAV